MICGPAEEFLTDDSDYETFVDKKISDDALKEVDPKKLIKNQIQSAILYGTSSELRNLLKNENVDNEFLNKSDGEDNFSLLFLAASNAKYEAIKLLIDYGADPKIKRNRFTLLMTVCNSSRDESHILKSVQTLTNCKGVNVRDTDKHGINCLMYACKNGYISVVRYLIPFSDLEHRDAEGWTALFYAVNCNQIEIVQMLLMEGVEYERTDARGNTPAQLAKQKCFKEIYEFLEGPEDEDSTENDLNCLKLKEDWRDVFPNLKISTLPLYFEELVNFMYGLMLPHRVSLLINHKIDFPRMLVMTDGELETIGFLTFERRQILEKIYLFHSIRWNQFTIKCTPTPYEIDMHYVFSLISTSVKHIEIMRSSLEYCLNRFKMIKTDYDDNIFYLNEINVKSQSIIHVDDLLKYIQDLKEQINSMKNHLKKLEKETTKIANKATFPPDYISSDNLKIKTNTFNKYLLNFSVYVITIGFLFRKRNLILNFCKNFIFQKYF